jgi:erythromycin esterase-like protein
MFPVLPDLFRNLFRRTNVDITRRIIHNVTRVTREQVLQYISNELADEEATLRRTRAYFNELLKFNNDDAYRTRIMLWLQNYGGEDRNSFD